MFGERSLPPNVVCFVCWLFGNGSNANVQIAAMWLLQFSLIFLALSRRHTMMQKDETAKCKVDLLRCVNGGDWKKEILILLVPSGGICMYRLFRQQALWWSGVWWGGGDGRWWPSSCPHASQPPAERSSLSSTNFLPARHRSSIKPKAKSWNGQLKLTACLAVCQKDECLHSNCKGHLICQ